MENEKTVYEQAKEKYDELMRETDNKVRQMQRALEKTIDADSNVIRARNVIAECEQKIAEAKAAFVKECTPLFSDLFFFDENYKNYNKDALDVAEKYPEIWSAVSPDSYISLFEPEYDTLSFDECIKILNNEYIKEHYVIRKEDGHSGRISNEFIDNLNAANKEKTNIALSKKNRLLRRKKLFSLFKSLSARLDAKAAAFDLEIQDRCMLSSLLSDISNRLSRARLAIDNMDALLFSTNLRNVKMHESVYKPYVRSLDNIIKSYKDQLQEKVDVIRQKAKIDALKKCFGKEALAKIATSGEDYFELGVISSQEGKISKYLRSEFSTSEKR